MSNNRPYHYGAAATMLQMSYAKYAERAKNRTRSLTDRVRSMFNTSRVLDARIDAMLVALCLAYVFGLMADHGVSVRWAQRAREAFEQVRPHFTPYWHTEAISYTPRNGLAHQFGPELIVPRQWPALEEIGREIDAVLTGATAWPSST
ncbi:hypothetical protein WEI85_19010 [Actinomycetes bacterium KLBMP 9797]